MVDLLGAGHWMAMGACLAGGAAARFFRGERALRGFSILVSSASLALSAGPALARIGAPLSKPGGGPGFELDEISIILLPFASLAFWVFTMVRPLREVEPAVVSRSFLAHCLTLLLFLARDATAIASLWILGIALLLWELRAAGRGQALSVASRYLAASALLFAAGTVLQAALPGSRPAAAMGSALIAGAVMLRGGIFPFHSWLPCLFEHGRWNPSLLYAVPQPAAYALAHLVVPAAPEGVLVLLGWTAALTAVYCSLAFAFQRDARRAFGYLFLGQTALVLLGLDSRSPAGFTGGLVLWLASGLSLAGMGAATWILESRRGRLSLDRLHGGYENKPLLAASFLLLGLASVGFPGTMGFVAQEALVSGAVERFPHVGLTVIAASALCGIGILRMFFSFFCGPGEEGAVHTVLRLREKFAVAALVLVLVAGGLAPGTLLALHDRAAARILELRSTPR